ncbi:MAG: glycerol dehydrogenase [Desulfarculus sp.]|nr:glycerol dehydrogenase [Desulfarculus sp.]
MLTITLFPGRYIQGQGALSRLGGECARLGRKALLIASPHPRQHLLPPLLPALQEQCQVAVESFGRECCDSEIQRLFKLLGETGADLVVGLGGGKTLDAAKAVAHLAQVPAIMVPTIASTDAPCSSVAVIYTPQGTFQRAEYLPRNPEVLIVDTQVMAQAPARRLCWDTLRDYGALALASCSARAVTPALERVVEANTLLSGLGFESAGLASAHSLHNGLTALPQAKAYYHGEKVAFGTLASLFLTDKPPAVVDQVYDFCQSVGLPTTLAGLGLEGVTDQDLRQVAEKACAPGESMHNEPCETSPAVVLDAIKAADAWGRARK